MIGSMVAARELETLAPYARAVTQRAAMAVLVALTMSLVGCGSSDGTKHVDIRGQVTLDGGPIENGTITYIPRRTDAGNGGSSPIKHGSFQLTEVPVGETVFTFSATVDTGRLIPGPGGAPEPERTNPIPAKYRTEGIVREITADGGEDFALTTK